MPAPVTTTIRRALTTVDERLESARRVGASFDASSIFRVVIGIVESTVAVAGRVAERGGTNSGS